MKLNKADYKLFISSTMFGHKMVGKRNLQYQIY